MATKQQSQVKIGAYFFNGAYRPFPNYPADFKVWNVNYDSALEFRTSPVLTALSGFERGNVAGHRISVSVNLRNTSATETEALRDLFNLFSSQYVRQFDTATLSATSATSATLAGKSAVNDFYVGAYLVQGSLKARITAYNGATKVATLVGDTLANGAGSIAIYPDKPTIVGISTDTNASNIIYCNPIGSNLSLARELTIGNQIISLSLKSVDRLEQIPEHLVIA